MLYHHDNRPYEVAAADASAKAKDKIEKVIREGAPRAAQIIEKVLTEVPEDLLVRGRAIQFDPLPTSVLAAIPTPRYQPQPTAQIPETIDETLERSIANGFKPDETVQIKYTIHDHAMSQMAYKFGIPWKYVQHLRDQGVWGNALLAHNFNEHFRNDITRRFLVRSYQHQVRGFLSDKYRRLDSRPLVEAFATACQDVGAIPIQGFGTDTKVQLKAMLPTIFEPAPNEVVAFYVVWQNSDYGDGAHQICSGMLRLWCTNYAVMDTTIRNVHIGKRLSEDVAYSERTHRLDTETMASAIEDTVKDVLGPESTTMLCDAIRSANEQQIDPRQALNLLKGELLKGEVNGVLEKYNSPDVEMLPPGNTAWRLSNAVSLFANDVEDVSRRMDLERFAGKVLSNWL
jgi:hypothetical protein